MSRDEGSFQDLAPLSGDPERDAGARRGTPASARIESAAPPLVPRSAGEILDLGLEIVRDRFAVITGTCVLLWLPVRVIEPLLGASSLLENQGSSEDPATLLLGLGGLMLTLFLQILVQTLASALVARLVYAAMHGERVTVGAALAGASRSVVGLIVIALLTGLASGIGCCFCFVPYVYLLWKLAVAPIVYVLEDVGIGNSLARSFALTTGSFLRWLALMVIVFFLTLPFSGPVAFQPQIRLFVIDVLSMPPTVCDVVIALVSSIFMGLATSISAVTMTVFYLDSRVRREGYDARRELEEMRARESLPPAAAGASA